MKAPIQLTFNQVVEKVKYFNQEKDTLPVDIQPKSTVLWAVVSCLEIILGITFEVAGSLEAVTTADGLANKIWLALPEKNKK